jgi:hypothetical protein
MDGEPEIVKEPSNAAIVRYLLGRASAREQTRMEEVYFTDSGFLGHLLAVEDDLIDAYVRGELIGEERNWFETYFLAAPGRQEKLKMAQSLLESLDAVPVVEAAESKGTSWNRRFPGMLAKPAVPVDRLALAILLLILVGAAVWLSIANRSLNNQLRSARDRIARIEEQERELQSREASQSTPEGTPKVDGNGTGGAGAQPNMPEKPAQGSSAPPRLPEAVASLVLTPGISRGAGDYAQLNLPEGARVLELKLLLPPAKGDYLEYRAELGMSGGRSVWTATVKRNRLQAAAESVTFRVPSNTLHLGDYHVTLRGISPQHTLQFIDDYAFGLVRKQSPR